MSSKIGSSVNVDIRSINLVSTCLARGRMSYYKH